MCVNPYSGYWENLAECYSEALVGILLQFDYKKEFIVMDDRGVGRYHTESIILFMFTTCFVFHIGKLGT